MSFTWCDLCEAKAFVKSRLGKKVILDCGHVADADNSMAIPTTPRQFYAGPVITGRSRTSTPNVRETQRTPEPSRVQVPVQSFSSTAVGQQVADLLWPKGRK